MQKYTRTFLPSDFSVTAWTEVKPFYDNLLARDISAVEQLRKFLSDWSELEGILQEDAAWRYIHASCDTTSQQAQERYAYYLTDLAPHLDLFTNQLQQKVMASSATAVLKKEPGFEILFKKIENDLRCYHEENIAIQTEIQLNTQKYGTIVGAMTIELAGKTYTLPQAVAHLESTDRVLRKEVYDKIQQRRLQDKEVLDRLYSTLIQQRHRMAIQAGFNNFRDYSFVRMHRFDYTPEDCFTFHKAIQEEIVPLLNELAADRKKQLALSSLQPFDHAVDLKERRPLRPFKDDKELISKTINIFDRLDPFLADCLRTMEKMGHLDLGSRKGKAPGGYNYPLDETGVPFIFMNSASTFYDVITMLHEGGHAIHAFLTNNLPLNSFKHCPSEVTELASMSMELLTMPHWDIFLSDAEELKRAKKEHLIHVISCLPWMAAIDSFQHWVYEHPHHNAVERAENWNQILCNFTDSITDWSDYEYFRSNSWQKQLHLFEVPFYYIEYAMAQLGAIGIWKNAQANPKKALQNYLSALRLGHTASIGTIYQTAGVPFDFSQSHIRSLAQSVREAWYAIDA